MLMQVFRKKRKSLSFLFVSFPSTINTSKLTLQEGKRLFNGKAVLGGFDNTPGTILYTGTDEEIKNEVFRILDEAGTVGVGIGADCTVDRSVTLARMEMIRRAAADYCALH